MVRLSSIAVATLASAGTACAFVPSSRRQAVVLLVRPSQPQPQPVSSALQLTLDDSWAEISQRIAFDPAVVKNNLDNVDLNGIEKSLEGDLASIVASLKQLVIAYQHLPMYAQVLIGLTPVALTAVSVLYSLSFPSADFRKGMEPYVRGNYDPLQAKAFYQKHPQVVVQRALQLFRLSNKFILALLIDKNILKREEKMRPQRAEELLQLITQLGPTAIKVGQALSVRPDIIPSEYATALSSLQDQVPPFESAQARQILQQELGASRYSELDGITNGKPVASASIGQVYKANINGKDVAVKVQRPNVLADIALDLYLVREFAPFYQKYIAKSQTDLQGLANEWGRGFIAELDYKQEARSTIRFNEEMQKRKLDAVCAPIVISDYSTEQILVTGWVDGVRLDRSEAEDIPRLCSVALNAYLVMLLELRSLHCDPHPGNLLRTTDGRLCILDFGMTLEIDPTLQYSLLEYLAHCTSNNYDKVPEDLVNMGFLKPERLEYAKRSGFLEPLVYFLKEAGKGGGANTVRDRVIADFRERYPGMSDDEMRKAVREEMKTQMEDVAKKESLATGVTTEVEELQKRNRDSFTIPEWFVYTSRAFGTLEGVSLQSDENFSLIQSSFPYIAKRLVGDDSPRAQSALREMIYGAGEMVDVDRLGDLADGFSSYTTTSKNLNKAHADGKDSRAKVVQAEAAITLAKDSADVFLDPKGNLVQTLLLEESALAASAQVKDQMKDAFVDGPQKFRDSLPLGIGGFLPPLPFEGAVAPFVKKTQTEEKAQLLVEKLVHLVQRSQTSKDGQLVIERDSLNNLVSDLDPEQAALVLKEVRENLPRYTPLVGQLGSKFVASLLTKASENIETTLVEMDLQGNNNDQLLKTAARGLSSAAKQGATAFQQQTTKSESKDKSPSITVSR